MTELLYLIAIALSLGLLGLGAFLWALKSGQFDDLDGAAHRILFDDEPPASQDAPQPKVNAAPGETSMNGR
ncbi:cbb3-type cytochrome oxidase assembly protein CcoS [Azospirillum rugosum]|uniref:Cbb3-type cytochrome oxidase maturation protein n=1 Tax=Azospirillum rugosum TaxID=416170 RepID=A0ABS4SVC1_9PROT|nr:cbb3-type cytochrome oxidase assembly protein CcoS [Azospirillum rugosum]MBP2295912.1 cbb3-type cytochrome oxidase maturation protein [Azospirillum rugosum]MDQ0530169.1 cbb3-type cytochrome oxidase maturation protein [Azospirillum rugosum]